MADFIYQSEWTGNIEILKGKKEENIQVKCHTKKIGFNKPLYFKIYISKF